jgi:hypothetical protein
MTWRILAFILSFAFACAHGQAQITTTTFPSGSVDRQIIQQVWEGVSASSSSPKLRWIESIQGNRNLGIQDNDVFQLGHNVLPGGVLQNPAYSGIRDGWESYFEPNVPGVGQHERHMSIHPVGGGEIRMLTFTAPANVTLAQCVPVGTSEVGTMDYWHPMGVISSIRLNTGSSPLFQGSVYTKYIRTQSSAANDNLVLIAKGSAGHLFQSVNGTLFQVVDPGAPVTAWLQFYGGAGANGGVLIAVAGNANAPLMLSARGTGKVSISNGSGEHMNVTSAGITTNAPVGDVAKPWKLGSIHPGYVEVEIDGVTVKLATVP